MLEHHVFSQSSCSAVVDDKNWHSNATGAERLSALAHAIAIESYSNTEAKARQHAGRNMALYNQIVAQAKACIIPGFRFYQQKLSVQFHNIVVSVCPHLHMQ